MKNYKNIDCVIINQKELQHEMRDRNSKIEILRNLIFYKFLVFRQKKTPQHNALRIF